MAVSCVERSAGHIGITLDSRWSEPADTSLKSKEAAERELQFEVSSFPFTIPFLSFATGQIFSFP